MNVYPPNPTVDPCTLVLKFVDLENNVFVDEAGEEVAMAVTLGTDRTHPFSASLRLPFKVAISSDNGGRRVLIRPVVSENPENDTCASIVAVLEV